MCLRPRDVGRRLRPPGQAILSCCLLLSIAGCQGRPAPDPALVEQPAQKSRSRPIPRPPRPDPIAEEIAAPLWPGDATQPPQLVSAEMLDEGWIALFDGLTFMGWTLQGRQNWRIEDGAIVVDQGDEPTLLCTTSRFGDFHLRLEFQADPQTNSGVFLRTPLQPQDPGLDCYEVNIAPPDNPFPTASVVKRRKADAVHEASADAWRTMDMELQGGHLVVRVDGRQVLDYRDEQPLEAGYIGLQHNQGRVAFRNVLLKPLGGRALFNGEDLTGWRTHPEMDGEFLVTAEGWLQARGGRGQLETEASFSDFVLQLECKTNSPGLNSGVFFRCVPGAMMDGYESQIHNGFFDGDRTQPEDFGTGAIFRRRQARLVATDDLRWFAKTIVADGSHFSIWVNGLQVTDWHDSRPVDVNPRRGLRLEPGTIMLQGHDSTTDVLFRKVTISDL